MRSYVAGRTSSVQLVNAIQTELEDRGHKITHDWTGKEGGIKPDWSHHPGEALVVATKDRDGAAQADVVIICGWGCEENNKGGLGCFIEVGIAIALRIPVVIVGPMRESVFWYLPQVERIEPHTGRYAQIQEISKAVDKAEEMVGHV